MSALPDAGRSRDDESPVHECAMRIAHKRYDPGFKATVKAFLPTKPTAVETSIPGPIRWKLWMLAWSSTLST